MRDRGGRNLALGDKKKLEVQRRRIRQVRHFPASPSGWGGAAERSADRAHKTRGSAGARKDVTCNMLHSCCVKSQRDKFLSPVIDYVRGERLEAEGSDRG